MKIYFVINYPYNHQTIMDQGNGASEVLFYMTAYKLAKFFDVVVYNHGPVTNIGNVEYKLLEHSTPIDISNSIIIIKTQIDLAIDFHKINPSNKYIVWSHDYLESDFPKFMNWRYSVIQTNDYLSKNNIQIVSASQFHKKNILSLLPDIQVTAIYHALYSEYYRDSPEIQHDKNKIIFASSWGKGLENVLRIGTLYYNINKDFRLLLISPSYCAMFNLDFSYTFPFVEKIGCIKNKEEYSKLLQSCLAVFSTSYPETFGCVFAEALHLGVPVIGDNSVESGSFEIIPKEHICDFKNPMEVIGKIEEFRKNRPTVYLNNKFYSTAVLTEWQNLLYGVKI